jgi:anti-sigma-K factor RskA
VESNDVHELTVPYALDALDPRESREFEDHLRQCESCRDEVALLRTTAASLAHDAPPAAPPPELRERILATARAERGNVVPLRPRWAVPAAAVAAVAACAALAFGIWAQTLHHALGTREAALRAQARALSIAADPDARRIPLTGGHGSLVVDPRGRAALLLARLPSPGQGKVFEAWVMSGGIAAPAGVFSDTGQETAVALERTVPRGASVAVTIERAGGAKQPSGAPILRSRATA